MKGIDRGAEIVIKKWVKLKPWEKLLIVTSEETIEELKHEEICIKEKCFCRFDDCRENRNEDRSVF